MELSAAKSALFTLPMLLVTAFMLSAGKLPSGFEHWLSFAAVLAFFNTCFFMILRSGKTDRWRAPVFIALSLSFVFTFIAHMLEVRGTMALKDSVMLEGGAPFCHVVIPQTLIPLLVSRTVIFPGTITGGYAAIGAMLFLWIGFSLALGRGWCGWGCFFGGLDDMFSRLRAAPVINRINPKWTDISVAVLIVTALASAASLSPEYCKWLCPYKAVTEFPAVQNLATLIQMLIFAALFIALVIALPLLTKKRTQCGLFCPFGAFQSLANRVNPFEMRVDTQNCAKCGACITACPVFAMTQESLAAGKTRLNCIKCGKCADVCPKQAVYHHVKMTENRPSLAQRLMFLFPAFMFLTTITGGMLLQAVRRIVHFAGTGSFC
ncbi:MAG: 4Fe-4S binding protein [Elusimicrobiales bacterium]|nr:4Fe-4S binding protein [Elusimicrobiales bacterium]